MLKHNKKRNIGLLNEFFAQYIALSVVDFRHSDVNKAKGLWRKYVANNKEVNKEFQLFETLYSTNIKDRNVAYNLLQKVKEQAHSLDAKKIESVKTQLLHEINSQLGGPQFFDKAVDDYRTNATIQLLINAWKSEEKGFAFTELSKLEDQVIEHLTRNKEALPAFDSGLLEKTQDDIDQIVINIFREKIEKKYNDSLNEEQKNLVGLYVFSKKQGTAKEQLVERLTEIKSSTLLGIEEELSGESQKTPSEKLQEVRDALQHYNVNDPDDETVMFYLGVCGLKHELETE